MSRSSETRPDRAASLPSSRKRQTVTLRDVARHAGVAVMTASRALNKPHMVSSELRERIGVAVEELGYIPDRVAGNLASGTGEVVPVLIPTLNHGVYVPVLNALQDDLTEAGYQILLGTSEYDPAREEQSVQTLLGWRPAGIVLSGVDHSPRTVQMLRSTGIPVIELMDLTDTPLGINIGFDHAEVGRAVARDLIVRGRRNAAYIGSVTRIDQRSVRRIKAFQDTLKAAGLPGTLSARSEQPSSVSLGGDLLRSLLRRHPEVDAVFCGNDDLAAGALLGAQRMGLRVPEDLAVLGFNDLDLARQLNPPLSSVRTPLAEMGHLAARLLLAQLRGEDVPEARHDVGFQIIHRATT